MNLLKGSLCPSLKDMGAARAAALPGGSQRPGPSHVVSEASPSMELASRSLWASTKDLPVNSRASNNSTCAVLWEGEVERCMPATLRRTKAERTAGYRNAIPARIRHSGPLLHSIAACPHRGQSGGGNLSALAPFPRWGGLGRPSLHKNHDNVSEIEQRNVVYVLCTRSLAGVLS